MRAILPTNNISPLHVKYTCYMIGILMYSIEYSMFYSDNTLYKIIRVNYN